MKVIHGECHADAGGTAIVLDTDQFTSLRVTVTVPGDNGSRGLIDVTTITATSTFSPIVFARSIDRTLVSVSRVYLPIIMK